MSRGIFRKNDLVKVQRTCCPEVPAGGSFKIGDRVHINSGSHDMTVVDFTSTHATVSWIDGDDTIEETYPLLCMHKARSR